MSVGFIITIACFIYFTNIAHLDYKGDVTKGWVIGDYVIHARRLSRCDTQPAMGGTMKVMA